MILPIITLMITQWCQSNRAHSKEAGSCIKRRIFINSPQFSSIKENKLTQLLLQFKAWLLSPKLFWWPIAFLNSFLLTLLLTFKIFKGISHIAQIIKCLSFLNLSRDLSSTRLSIHHLFILTSSKTSTFNSISHYISNILQT